MTAAGCIRWSLRSSRPACPRKPCCGDPVGAPGRGWAPARGEVQRLLEDCGGYDGVGDAQAAAKLRGDIGVHIEDGRAGLARLAGRCTSRGWRA